MKITKAHLDYWRQRTAPTPAWAAGVATKERMVTVDDLLTEQTPMRERGYDAHNLISILRSAAKRGELRSTLARLAEHPGCLINPKRRVSYARKWLKRLAS